jgi:hypothetical protein
MLNGDIFCEMTINMPIIAKTNKTMSPATFAELIRIGKINIRTFTN